LKQLKPTFREEKSCFKKFKWFIVGGVVVLVVALILALTLSKKDDPPVPPGPGPTPPSPTPSGYNPYSVEESTFNEKIYVTTGNLLASTQKITELKSKKFEGDGRIMADPKSVPEGENNKLI
jgi:alpha-glucosidase (family GH31 glycosyl hydrolase)